MKTSIKYFLIPFICIILFQVSGCIDDANYQIGYVNGVVYNTDGFPCTGTVVSVGNYPVTASDYNGKFILENLQIPYDLVISFESNFSNDCLKISGLHVNEPVINISGYPGNCVRFRIKVTFPEFKENQEMLLKFIGDKNSISETIRFPWFEDTIYYLNTYNKPGYINTEGKIIYLLRTLDPETMRAVSYDAFAFKNITLTSEQTTEVIFTKEDVSFNPEEIIKIPNIQYPPGAQPGYIRASLHFNNSNINNTLELESYPQGSSTRMMIPVHPGLNYKIKTLSVYFSEDNCKWIFTNLNDPVNIIHTEPLKILSPANNQHNVNDTTVFSVYDDGIKGIYLYKILLWNFQDYRTLTLITNKNSVRLSDLKSRVFYFYNDVRYIWFVTKYPNYNSIDEFVSEMYVFDERYDFIQSSERRSFLIEQ